MPQLTRLLFQFPSLRRMQSEKECCSIQSNPWDKPLWSHRCTLTHSRRKSFKTVSGLSCFFLIMCNASFATAANPWFLNFISSIQPNYTPPGNSDKRCILVRAKFSLRVPICMVALHRSKSFGWGIDARWTCTHETRLWSEYEVNIRGCKNATVSLDGWTDVSNKSIYAICLIMDDPGRTCFLLDVLDLSSSRHTAANLLGIFWSVIWTLWAFVSNKIICNVYCEGGCCN